MRPSRFTDAEMREALRSAREGEPAVGVCRRLGITQTTFYRWRARHDLAPSAESRRMRDLEDENLRLKQLVAELLLQARTPADARTRRR